MYLLTGPAVLVAFLSLAGMQFSIAQPIWNAALLVIGLRIGAGVNDEATAAFLRWPFAFLALAAMLFAIMKTSIYTLMRVFGFDKHSAVLASTPGHLSFVLSLGADMKADLPRISTVQTVRIVALILLVPFGAKAFGMDLGYQTALARDPMTIIQFLVLVTLGLAAGLALRRARVPAPVLIGGMLVSAIAHVSNLAPGAVSPYIVMPGFVVIGTMVGSRFSGISLEQLRRDGLAGIVSTAIAAGFAILAAWPVAIILGVPLVHVLVAFAPGGLETMVAIGTVLGANPGFLAASHVARLFILLALLPILIGRDQADMPDKDRPPKQG